MDRLNDMLKRYGEICTQKEAARILSVQPRSIHRMMEQGRLRRVGHRVDVRSIVEFIDNNGGMNSRPHNQGVGQQRGGHQGVGQRGQQGTGQRAQQSTSQRGRIDEGSFFAAARNRRWSTSQG